MKILTRYLLRELGLPLVVWVCFLFLILLVMQLLKGTDVLLGSAVTFVDFVRLISFLAPHFLVMAVPVAFLLAILLGLGRMSEDRELLVLNAAGIGPLELLRVPFYLAAFLGLVMLLLTSFADPWGQVMVKNIVAEVVKKNVIGDVKAGVFYEDLTNLTLYAQKVNKEKGRWTNVLVHDDRDPRAPLLVLAREGTVDAKGVGTSLTVALSRGEVHRAEQVGEDYTVLTFETGELAVGVGENINRKDRFRSVKDELTPGQLIQAAKEARASGRDPRAFWVAFHMRLGQVFAPLAFVLLGGPLAMGRRQARGRSYFIAILGYVAYYVLMRTFEDWGLKGTISPLLSGQGTNLVFALLGLVGLQQILRGGLRR